MMTEKQHLSDAEVLEWIGTWLLQSHWDGSIGRPCTWHMAGPYRHYLQRMRGNTLHEAVAHAIQSLKEKPL